MATRGLLIKSSFFHSVLLIISMVLLVLNPDDDFGGVNASSIEDDFSNENVLAPVPPVKKVRQSDR